VLCAHGLGFERAGRAVLTEVSIDVAAGSFTGLLGANGSGKTTLLRLLLGLIEPTRGAVMLDGTPLRSLSRRMIAARMAYVPQAHVAAFPFTVSEVVLMARAPASGWGWGRRLTAVDRHAAADALSRMGMTAFADRSYAALSGGERQSVLIARALAQGARILLLDEPTASLDIGQRTRVMQVLSDLAAHGHSIVMSVHDPDLALRWCDHALLLKAGRVIANGVTAETTTAAHLSNLYGLELKVASIEGFAGAVTVPSDRELRQRRSAQRRGHHRDWFTVR
jgi:iron complex transport system ATP-binding protein